jgi:hypothetical protein
MATMISNPEKISKLSAVVPHVWMAPEAYDVTEFVGDLRAGSVTPHIARSDPVTKTGKRRKSATDARTLRHAGYAISQCRRKRIEEVFGWAKTQAGLMGRP